LSSAEDWVLSALVAASPPLLCHSRQEMILRLDISLCRFWCLDEMQWLGWLVWTGIRTLIPGQSHLVGEKSVSLVSVPSAD
jgi:hypothetical protein